MHSGVCFKTQLDQWFLIGTLNINGFYYFVGAYTYFVFLLFIRKFISEILTHEHFDVTNIEDGIEKINKLEVYKNFFIFVIPKGIRKNDI